MCPWKPFWLATDLAVCRRLTSVQSVCDVGLGIRKGRLPKGRGVPGRGDCGLWPARIGARVVYEGGRSLLLQEAAVLLEAAVPATRFHAQGLAQTTVGKAGRY